MKTKIAGEHCELPPVDSEIGGKGHPEEAPEGATAASGDGAGEPSIQRHVVLVFVFVHVTVQEEEVE